MGKYVWTARTYDSPEQDKIGRKFSALRWSIIQSQFEGYFREGRMWALKPERFIEPMGNFIFSI